MVRITGVLCRIPVIKFRKGGLHAQARATASAGSAPTPAQAQGAPASQMQAAASMSTCIPDIDLPLRYRRLPLSQEEIDKINGGGIV